MDRQNARLTVVIAAVAVAAVAIGGTLAYVKSPTRDEDTSAAPLASAGTPTRPTILQTPSTTPSTAPATLRPSTPGVVGPQKVRVNLSKLSKGREPQVAYLVDREVRGGGGPTRKIPGIQGTDVIHKVARLGADAVAIVSGPSTDQLVRVGSGKPRFTAGVDTLVSGLDGSIAYSSRNFQPGGGTVYFETTVSVRKLVVPAPTHELKVLAVAKGKVYYHWKAVEDGPWKLFEWTPGMTTPKQLKTVESPDIVSPDGEVAGSTTDSAPGEGEHPCTTAAQLATGKRLWRNCETNVNGFSPDGSVTIGTGGYSDIGNAAKITAQETSSGRLIREWTGVFGRSVAEDDQHVLMEAGNGGGDGMAKRAIVRCSITTGRCELATAITSTSQLGLSGWSW